MGSMSWGIAFAPLTPETLSLDSVQDECVPQRHRYSATGFSSSEHLALLPHQQVSGRGGAGWAK